MSWKLSTLSIALLGMFASSLAACGHDCSQNDAGPKDRAPAVAPADAGPRAAVSEADRKLIEKQKVCPVTDEPLGSMGQPVKVVVKKRTVFLCCAGCKKKLLANPDKYLKKLDERK